MEVTLEDTNFVTEPLTQKSFNPYSNGSYSGRQISRLQQEMGDAMFQSLF